MTPRLARAACLLLSVVVAAPSFGQGKPAKPTEPPSLSQALTGDAKQDYETGRMTLADGDYATALMKFQSAYDKSKDPRLLWNMAVCEKNQRHYAKVTKLVARYKKEGAALISAKDAQEAEDLLWALRSLTSSIRVTVNEPDAEVFVDEESVGTSPIADPIVVDIGARKVRVVKAGFREQTSTVQVGNTPELAVNVKLEHDLHEGRVVVTARSGDDIALDGKHVAVGRWESPVPSGSHTVRVTAKGMRPYQSEVVVQEKETRTLAVTLESEKEAGGKLPVWLVVAGGAVLVSGAAVGGYFLFRPDPKPGSFPTGNLDPGYVETSRR